MSKAAGKSSLTFLVRSLARSGSSSKPASVASSVATAETQRAVTAAIGGNASKSFGSTSRGAYLESASTAGATSSSNGLSTTGVPPALLPATSSRYPVPSSSSGALSSLSSTNGSQQTIASHIGGSSTPPLPVPCSSTLGHQPYGRPRYAQTVGQSTQQSEVQQSQTQQRESHQQQQQRSRTSPSASILPSFWNPPASSYSSSPLPFIVTASTSAAVTSPSLPKDIAASTSSSISSTSSSEIPAGWRLDRTEVSAPSARSTHQSQLVLHPGAYGIPKRPKRNDKGKGRESDLQTELDAAADAHQQQIAEMQRNLLSVQVGEDAYFVRHNSLGVADGVGGWSGRKGADPGLFAARLMHHCSLELGSFDDPHPTLSRLAFVASSSTSSLAKHHGTNGATSSTNLHDNSRRNSRGDTDSMTSDTDGVAADPIEILHRAWDTTLCEFLDLELIGSTTALIALLTNNELRLANLGDCCCSIIRGKDYIFRSQEQQHAFNYPFQVGTNSHDTPRKDGQRFSIKVQRDDIVILSSDGLVDNLFDEDILEEVLFNAENPQLLSQALCARAKAVSEDQRAVSSPFQQRANEEGIHFVGGKHDDISVLVAVIGDSEQASI